MRLLVLKYAATPIKAAFCEGLHTRATMPELGSKPINSVAATLGILAAG
jgi:hypothetical protein